MRVAITISPNPKRNLLRAAQEEYGRLIFTTQWGLLSEAFRRLMTRVNEYVEISGYTLYPEFNKSGMIHGHGWIETPNDPSDSEFGALQNAINVNAIKIFGSAITWNKYTNDYDYVAWKVKAGFGEWDKWVQYCLKSEDDVKILNKRLKKPLEPVIQTENLKKPLEIHFDKFV